MSIDLLTVDYWRCSDCVRLHLFNSLQSKVEETGEVIVGYHGCYRQLRVSEWENFVAARILTKKG